MPRPKPNTNGYIAVVCGGLGGVDGGHREAEGRVGKGRGERYSGIGKARNVYFWMGQREELVGGRGRRMLLLAILESRVE